MKNILFLASITALIMTVVFTLVSIWVPVCAKPAFLSLLLFLVIGVLYIIYRKINDEFDKIDNQLNGYMGGNTDYEYYPDRD